MKNKNNKTISLALGSGGARGYAHIGATIALCLVLYIRPDKNKIKKDIP